MTPTARRLAITCAAMFLLLPAAAQAATVSVSDGTLTLDAETSFLDVDLEPDGGDVIVYDWSGELSPGAGCEEAPPDPVSIVMGAETTNYTCTGSTRLAVLGGAGADYVFSFLDSVATMAGNGGDDTLQSSRGTAHLDGGDGNDDLGAGKGADTLAGGAGRDRIFTDGGGDTITGGEGRDTLMFAYSEVVTFALDPAASIEIVTTGVKDDVVTGDDRFNELTTSDGNDTVDGRGGNDLIDTGAGDDTVLARDGVADDITCGDGNDRVTADPDDFVDGCETVDRAALVPVTPAAPPAPTLELTAIRRAKKLVVSGRLTPASPACTGGGITVSVAGIGTRVRRIGTVLKPGCTFSVRLRATRKQVRRARVSASFAGTPGLSPASAAPVRAARR